MESMTRHEISVKKDFTTWNYDFQLSPSIKMLSSTFLSGLNFPKQHGERFILFGDKCWWIRNTLYVSKGIADTWSNHITPFLDVVNWSLELGFVPLASNRTSVFVQFETSESLPKKTQTPSQRETIHCKIHSSGAHTTLAAANICDPSELVNDTDTLIDPRERT